MVGVAKKCFKQAKHQDAFVRAASEFTSIRVRGCAPPPPKTIRFINLVGTKFSSDVTAFWSEWQAVATECVPICCPFYHTWLVKMWGCICVSTLSRRGKREATQTGVSEKQQREPRYCVLKTIHRSRVKLKFHTATRTQTTFISHSKLRRYLNTAREEMVSSARPSASTVTDRSESHKVWSY